MENKLLKDQKLSRNPYADNLKYLNTDMVTASKLKLGIENMLVTIYGAMGKVFSNRSPYKIILNALRELQSLNFFAISEAVNEHNILLAENEESIRGIASAHGFQAHRGKASAGTVNIKILSGLVAESGATSITIDNNAIITSDKNSLPYLVQLRKPQYVVDFSRGADIDIEVIQGTLQTATYVGDGENLQITSISSQSIISEGSIKVMSSSGVTLNQKGLFRDLQANDDAYLVRTGFHGDININFGNSGVGYKPKLGEVITIEYVECDGQLGNLSTGLNFTVTSGFNISDSDANITEFTQIITKTDFINGYNGDSADIIKLNVGSQSTSNVVATPDQVKSYLRAYPQYSVSEIWRQPGTAVINALLCPNLKQLTTNTDYFSLTPTSFTISDTDKLLIKQAIFNDKQQVLVSNIDFKTYTIANFSALVFIKLKQNSLINNNLRQEIISNISDVLVSSWGENTRQIHKSDIITMLQDSITEINSIDITFISDSTGVDYIDEIGDIDTREIAKTNSSSILTADESNFNYVVPVLSPIIYDGTQFTHAIKILVEESANDFTNKNSATWVEI
jgi:hypothetical protein